MAVNGDWLQQNDNRNYPLSDLAGRQVGGSRLPNNLLCDAHISVPLSLAGSTNRVYVSQLSITKPRVFIQLSVESVGPILDLEVFNPQAYRNYLLRDLQPGCHGFICFGSAVATGVTSFAAESVDVEQAHFLPSLVSRSPTATYPHLTAAGQQLTGTITVRGTDGIKVSTRVINAKQSLVIEMEDDLQLLESVLGPCQIPLESGNIPPQLGHPILSVNGVLPDAGGKITLDFAVPTYTYENTLGNQVTAQLIDVLVESNILRFRPNFDFRELCGTTRNRVIRYKDQPCGVCGIPTEPVDPRNPFTGNRLFIHRDLLVVEWLYTGYGMASNGSDGLIAGAAPLALPPFDVTDDITFDVDSELSVVELVSFQEGFPQRLSYDVNDDCEPPIPISPVPAQPSRFVFRLNRTVRDTSCQISVEIAARMAMETSAPGQLVLVTKWISPPIKACGIPVLDPFVFDEEYMTPDEESAIEDDLEDYLDGLAPPWN